MAESLKEKVIKGVVWDGFQKFGTMAITFVSNLILARLLVPVDFGTLGLIMAFISISNAFIDGGFTSALIQKGNPSNEDMSSVFFLNLFISVFFYIALFVFSPQISIFFHAPLLTNTLRVTGLILIFNAISIIQLTQLQINLNFKKQAKYNLIATFFGTTLGIVLALIGYGVWSLVFRTLLTSILLCCLVWIYSQWRPLWHFSYQRVKSLFNFGGFIFLSTLIEYLYANIQPILIGKFFTLGQLGYYTQARKLEEIPTNTLTGIISSVTFPVYSKLKDDKVKLKNSVRKSLLSLSYIAVPLMALMILVAKPLIVLLLGSKWIDAYPFLQILCIAGVFRIPSGINMNLIMSIGKSKSFLSVQVFKRVIGAVAIIVGSLWGIIGLMWGFAVASFLFFAVDSLLCGNYLNYGFIEESKDMVPYFLMSTVSAIITINFISFSNIDDMFISLVLKVLIFSLTYVLIAAFTRNPSQSFVWGIIKDKILKK